MRKVAATGAALLALCSVALGGDVSGKGPNGGRLADATTMHVEFLSKGAEVFVYTYDHDNKPVPTTGMTGRVTVQEKGKTRTTDLTAEAPNRLTGKFDAPLDSAARVLVSLTPKGGKPVQARYTAN
jgi:hypothetical protein